MAKTFSKPNLWSTFGWKRKRLEAKSKWRTVPATIQEKRPEMNKIEAMKAAYEVAQSLLVTIEQLQGTDLTKEP